MAAVSVENPLVGVNIVPAVGGGGREKLDKYCVILSRSKQNFWVKLVFNSKRIYLAGRVWEQTRSWGWSNKAAAPSPHPHPAAAR